MSNISDATVTAIRAASSAALKRAEHPFGIAGAHLLEAISLYHAMGMPYAEIDELLSRCVVATANRTGAPT